MAYTFIDSGLPEGRDEWPPGLLDHLRLFAQGDVVERPPFLYHADLNHPVWRRSLDYVEAGVQTRNEAVVASETMLPRFGVITTQTCDVTEEDVDQPSKPWVQIAPVYDGASTINSGFRTLLKKGRGPRHLFHLPDVPEDGFWVADLRIEVPVEKGWLLDRQPMKALPDAVWRARFTRAIGRVRTRPAFAGSFVETIQRPLVERLRTERQSDPTLFERLDNEVVEALVQLDDSLAPSVVQLVLISESPISQDARAWFDEWWDECVHVAAAAGIDLLPMDYREFDGLNAAEYRSLHELPLDRVSPE